MLVARKRDFADATRRSPVRAPERSSTVRSAARKMRGR